MGVLSNESSQIVFIDTPGIHQASKELNRRLVQYAWSTVHESDLCLWLVEPLHKKFGTIHPLDEQMMQKLQTLQTPVLVVLNKTDLISQEDILQSISYFSETLPFADIVPVSAKSGYNVNYLLQMLHQTLPDGQFCFDPSQMTNCSDAFLASEFVREQAFRSLRQELPYAFTTLTEHFEEKKNIIFIDCLLLVEQDSQKGIIIGHQGSMLKKIGSAARKKLEGLFGKKVFLNLHVKVSKRWSENPKELETLGFSI